MTNRNFYLIFIKLIIFCFAGLLVSCSGQSNSVPRHKFIGLWEARDGLSEGEYWQMEYKKNGTFIGKGKKYIGSELIYGEFYGEWSLLDNILYYETTKTLPHLKLLKGADKILSIDNEGYSYTEIGDDSGKIFRRYKKSKGHP